MRKRARCIAFIGLFGGSVSCGNAAGPSAPLNAMVGSYTGSTSKADIRMQVEYGTQGGPCTGNLAECLAQDFLQDNLHGSGSITLRATGEAQSFQLTGFEATNVGITFHQDIGVMAGARMYGLPSADGRTVQGFIYAAPLTGGNAIFGDSVAIALLRQ